MMYLLFALLLVLALTFWNLNSRNQYAYVAVGHGVLAVIVFFMLGQDILPNEKDPFPSGLIFFVLISGILLFHMVASHLWKRKEIIWPPIFVLISSFIFLVLPFNTFNYNGFSVELASLPVLLLPFLGACIEPIANIKEKVLGNFFTIDFKNRRGISRSVYFLLFGIGILVAQFLASYLGIALLTLGFGASLFYKKSSSALWNMFLALLALSSLGHFAQEARIEESSLLVGRVLAGIFVGGFLNLFINTSLRARKHKNLATVLNWFLLISVPTAILLAGRINVNFGGSDAYLGILVGFAISAAFGINTRKNDSVLAVYFALAILLIPLTINKEEVSMSKITLKDVDGQNTEKIEDPFELDGKVIELIGEYQILTENSQLTFELGPVGGRTKGAFKTFIGNFAFGERNQLKVVLPVKSLTTFNGYRDESLMDEGYFNSSKFPEMSFQSKSFTLKSTGYEVIGDFTMLGKTKELALELKYLGKSSDGQNEVFIGRSRLNRVDFGMKSDPKEGNIVDFQFKVELKKT